MQLFHLPAHLKKGQPYPINCLDECRPIEEFIAAFTGSFRKKGRLDRLLHEVSDFVIWYVRCREGPRHSFACTQAANEMLFKLIGDTEALFWLLGISV